MGERKGVNKYYPPDFDPRKGSLDKQRGQHPLRDRARKLSQGILVIRFELPYNIWCGGCGNHVGMGVRYNAEKSKVGHYYSTPIYKFRMKCHLCDNYFEIQTDPKNHDYVILSGARRKEQRWDPKENGQVVPEDKAVQKKLALDAMYKLEHGHQDKQRGQEGASNLAQLQGSRLNRREDYLLNRLARDQFRAEKKVLKEAAEADQALLDKCALDLELVQETEEDRRLAGLLKYSVTASFEEKQKERRKTIDQRSIFDTSSSSSTPSSSSSSSSVSSAGPAPRPKAGEVRDHLGKVLKASYKDPFQLEDKGQGQIWSLTSGSSSLGVKLKSEKNLSGRPAGSMPRASPHQHTQQKDRACPAPDGSESELSSQHKDPKHSPLPVSHSQTASSDHMGQHTHWSADQALQELTPPPPAAVHPSDDQCPGEAQGPGVSPASASQRGQGLTDASSVQSAFGLQALMSSYTASDSEGSDSTS